MPSLSLARARVCVCVCIDSVLTHIFSWRILLAPVITPQLVWPLAACGVYELLFDYGQHMHTYATQNLHLIICMCFEV